MINFNRNHEKERKGYNYSQSNIKKWEKKDVISNIIAKDFINLHFTIISQAL